MTGPGPAPAASSPAVRERMRKVRVRDTGPELAVRRLAHAAGLRYFVDRSLPGMPRRRADMLFPRARVAVFVDGCFWHGCPEHWKPPRSSAGWWRRKMETNQARDAEVTAYLRSIGWEVVRAWEHEPAQGIAARVREAVRRRTG